jgi:hypothetical protein
MALVLGAASVPGAWAQRSGALPAAPSAAVLGVTASADVPLIDASDGWIRLPGREGGTLQLAVVAPKGVAATIDFDDTRGWKTTALVPDRMLRLRFEPDARQARVTITYRDPQGIEVATIRRTLSTGAGARIPRSASPVVLDWVEPIAVAAVVDRRLRIETAIPDPEDGCRDWQTVDERQVDVQDPAKSDVPANRPFSGPAPEDVRAVRSARGILDGSSEAVAWSDLVATWSASLDVPAVERPDIVVGGDVQGTERVEATVAHGRLTIPVESDGCHRFTLETIDADGNAGSWTWPAVAAERLVDGKRTLPRFEGRLDLYRAGAFATQQTYTWCIGATSQMMVALITGARADPLSQRYLMSYAKTHDRVNDREFGGSDDYGASAILARFAGASYEVLWVADTRELMRTAALRIRRSGLPVKTTVMDGHHAWVIHGFEARVDPLLDNGASVTAVYVSGPLWPRAAQAGGFDPPPDTRLDARELAAYLSPSRLRGPWKLLVPIPGPLRDAARQPRSLGEVGLWGWPLNLFTATRSTQDSRLGAPIVDSEQPPTSGPTPSPIPTATPDPSATSSPGPSPTDGATPDPTLEPTPGPTPEPTPEPTSAPTPEPTVEPTPEPTPSETPP